MSKLSDPTLRYVVPASTIHSTLAFLHAQGARDEEGVIFWPGHIEGGVCRIAAPIIPRQLTSRVSFRIPTDEVFRILRLVSEASMVIPIQVHSHPEEACHSIADDTGALVRHVGALSIVAPYWAAFEAREFFFRTKSFRMDELGRWVVCDAQPRFTVEDA